MIQVNLVHVLHQPDGLLTPDMLVQRTAKRVGDVVLPVGKRARAAKPAHDGTPRAANAGLHLLAVDGTLSLIQRIARLENGNLQAFILLYQLVCGKNAARPGADNNDVIFHNHFSYMKIYYRPPVFLRDKRMNDVPQHRGFLIFHPHLPDNAPWRNFFHRHLHVLAIIDMLVRIYMATFHRKRPAWPALGRQRDFSVFIRHVKRLLLPIGLHLVITWPHRPPAPCIHVHPYGRRPRQMVARLVIQEKITLTDNTLKRRGKRAHTNLLPHLRITVNDNLPVRKHPRPLLLFQAQYPVPDVLRLERAAILKIIDNTGERQRPPMVDFTISHSRINRILHDILLPP